MSSGIVLYGPPASGKDTVTAALGDPYRMVPRRKAGPGRTTGYHMVTDDELAALRSQPGEVLWQVERYRATYVLTRSDLAETAAIGVPVLHVGQAEAVPAVTVPGIAWTVVELWCPREVAAARIAARSTDDDAARLAAYDATPRLAAPDVSLDTDTVQPAQAAQIIRETVAA